MQQMFGVLKLSLPGSEQTHFRCSTSVGRQETSEQGQSLGDMSLCRDGPSLGIGFLVWDLAKVPGEESKEVTQKGFPYPVLSIVPQI